MTTTTLYPATVVKQWFDHGGPISSEGAAVLRDYLSELHTHREGLGQVIPAALVHGIRERLGFPAEWSHMRVLDMCGMAGWSLPWVMAHLLDEQQQSTATTDALRANYDMDRLVIADTEEEG
jgi:hypothetical protein